MLCWPLILTALRWAAAYFLDYIDRGQYDGATLYRSLPMDGEAIPQLVQGGVLKDALNSTQPIDLASYGVKTLLPEWTTTAESGTPPSQR